MKPHRSICGIVLACGLIVAISANTALCQPWDPLGIHSHSHYKPFGKKGPTLTITVLDPAKVLSGGSLGQANRKRVAQRVRSSRMARFDNLNLAVTMPRGPWVKLNPKETGSRACYLVSRQDPTVVISLAGERVGTEAGHTNDSLLADSQAKMESLPEGVVLSGERKLSTNGIQGVAYEASSVAENGTTVHYSIWVAAHNGYNYSLAVYGEESDQPEIDETMLSFLRGIKPIQPRRVSRTGSQSRRG